jgi:hypothetical protein
MCANQVRGRGRGPSLTGSRRRGHEGGTRRLLLQPNKAQREAEGETSQPPTTKRPPQNKRARLTPGSSIKHSTENDSDQYPSSRT